MGRSGGLFHGGVAALALVALLCAPMNPLSAGQDASWLKTKPVTPLWIVSPDARCWRFHVWVASTPVEFTRGLMFVKALPDDAGMLFGLGNEREISMWMRNTFIPLDILFVDASGKIVKLHENAEPLSLDHISSGQAVYAVLELPGGAARTRGIQPGDSVRHVYFGTGDCQE